MAKNSRSRKVFLILFDMANGLVIEIFKKRIGQQRLAEFLNENYREI